MSIHTIIGIILWVVSLGMVIAFMARHIIAIEALDSINIMAMDGELKPGYMEHINYIILVWDFHHFNKWTPKAWCNWLKKVAN